MKMFVDTDIFVALAKEDDSNHIKAKELLQDLIKTPVSFITSNYVFSECVTIISQRVSHAAAMKFIATFKAPTNVFITKWITPGLETSAIEIFKKQTSKNTSLVDCTNMALMLSEKLDAIFSFDDVYRKNHFKLAHETII